MAGLDDREEAFLAFAMGRIVAEAGALVNAWPREHRGNGGGDRRYLAAAGAKIVVLRRTNLADTGVCGGQVTQPGAKAGLPAPRML